MLLRDDTPTFESRVDVDPRTGASKPALDSMHGCVAQGTSGRRSHSRSVRKGDRQRRSGGGNGSARPSSLRELPTASASGRDGPPSSSGSVAGGPPPSGAGGKPPLPTDASQCSLSGPDVPDVTVPRPDVTVPRLKNWEEEFS